VLAYIGRRFLHMMVLLIAVSVVSFAVINLPPGDYLTSYIVQLESSGAEVREDEAAALRAQYGLDLPVYAQYAKWMWNLLRGDFGLSFEWNRPVGELIAERLPFTLVTSIVTATLTYVIAIPVGIYSATHQYSAGDWVFTVIGFLGMAIPNFLLALFLMFLFYKFFNISIGGLFSQKYIDAPWSFAKFKDLINHLWVPVLVVGMSGTASVIRRMRGVLLDELNRPYVTTARAKGLTENRLLLKYPVRIAMNPIISTIGWLVPWIFSGNAIVSIVLNLPTMGPLLLRSLLSQDMFIAGSITLVLSSLTVVGMFLSDLLLGWTDPRIRFQ
jgi:peptide/nickel transport system permease protein